MVNSTIFPESDFSPHLYKDKISTVIMKVSLTTSLLLCSVVALALPTDVTSQPIDPETGLLLPHYYDEIDLDDYEAWEKAGGNDTDFEPLVKRTQIAVCSYTTHHGDCMTFLGSGLESVSRQIAVRFYDASKNDNCDHFTGASASFNWDQHATNKDPSSNACGTTANVGTINGAIQNYFRSTGSGSCGVKCLQLSHGEF